MVKMVDTRDLNSLDLTVVRVRVPFLALKHNLFIMENGITINGVRHKLVTSSGLIYDCEICSLQKECEFHNNCFCADIFDDSDSHFEIEE